MEISEITYNKAVPTIGTKEGDAALREKTDQFEALIIKMMLDEAMKEEKNLFSANDPGDKIFKSMYREELSNASAGGFGFSQMLFEHLSQKGGKAE
ncbi:rod-binding protein [Sulfuricurvum sp.]|uniref:rod-binding protein n=1 Tax=Sulfuricurvum sp. TaxID=2025608 RepID=UPI00198EDC37|nr:rod-binding protein [Sulfuricurvum sp.]MBD3798900.1 rod-binding protein [Campylobacterota bacterium]MBD3805746.1 rod-binding protein [Sulfuricurvum sp.]